MPNPAAAQIIAEGLPSLPHPDGHAMQFVNFTTFPGQPEETQAQIRDMSKGTAEAIVNLLERNGLSIVDTRELAQPTRFGKHTQVKVHCKSCAGQLLEMVMGQDGIVSIPARTLVESIKSAQCRCLAHG